MIEVEAVDDGSGDDAGGEDTWSQGIGGPVLILVVGLETKVWAEVEVETEAWGEDGRSGGQVGQGANGDSAAVVVDLSAADEEVDVGVEVTDLMFEFKASEDGLLAGDGSRVDGIGSTDFEAGVQAIVGADGDIGAGCDAEVVSVEDVGVDAGATGKCRELEALRCGGCSLGVRGVREEESRCEDGEAQAGFQWLHPRLNLRLMRRDRP